jgi:hypothetical protein
VAEPEAPVVEESPLVAPLDSPFGPPGEPPFIPLGSGQVAWYDGGDTWVVVFLGLDLDGLGAFCPGSSIEVSPDAFEGVSNTPTEPGACEGYTTPEASMQRCGEVLIYDTLIPMDAQGTLYGSVGVPVEGGSYGVLGTVEADPASAPPLEPGAEAYSTPDGEVTCSS